jgi:hypothetical protein
MEGEIWYISIPSVPIHRIYILYANEVITILVLHRFLQYSNNRILNHPDMDPGGYQDISLSHCEQKSGFWYQSTRSFVLLFPNSMSGLHHGKMTRTYPLNTLEAKAMHPSFGQLSRKDWCVCCEVN